jgi:CHAT domain-containing protein/tetratricopeptide (TPR) repeat protein
MMFDWLLRRKVSKEVISELRPLVARFVVLTDINDIGDFIEANPALISRPSDDVFRQLLDFTRASGNRDNESAVEAHWELAKKARALGIKKALEEYDFVPKELRALVAALRKLTPQEQAFFEKQSGSDYESLLREHPDLGKALDPLREQTSGESEEDSDKVQIPGIEIPADIQQHLVPAFAARERFELKGLVEDLDEAITEWERILHLSSLDGSSKEFRAMVFNDAAGCYVARYQQGGRSEDIASAIGLLEKASRLKPGDATVLINRGTFLMYRYKSAGDFRDLEAALEALEKTERLIPSDSNDRMTLLNSLGNAYVTKHGKTGDRELLKRSKSIWKELLALVPANDQRRPMYLSNFGNALGAEGGEEGRRKAIEAYKEAVELTPEESPSYAGRLGNLGNALSHLYDDNGDIVDLKAALDALQKAADLTPPEAVYFPTASMHLADALLDLYKESGNKDILDAATKRFEQACHAGLVVDIPTALQSGGRWGWTALQREDWDQAAQGYARALRAFERLVYPQTSSADKEQRLSSESDKKLILHASYSLARAGKLEEAVTALDFGHARLMRQRLEKPSLDIEALQRVNPKLAEKYRKALHTIEKARGSEPKQSEMVGSEVVSHRILADAHRQFDLVLSEISRTVGFEGVGFGTDRFSRIADAVGLNDLFAYFGVTFKGSLILLLYRKGDSTVTVEPIWIDAFTNSDLADLLMREGTREGYLPPKSDRLGFEQGLNRALTSLGKNLFGHVARRARELETTTVVLIPDGVLSLLPLHAADYDGGQSCLIDEFDVIFAPAAFAVSNSRQAETALGSQAATFVGVGNPSGSAQELQFARVEVVQVGKLFPEALSRIFVGTEATKKNVTETLQSAVYLHFACHGVADVREPLNSRLSLAGRDELSLRDILGLGGLSKIRLATLSACETAVVGFELPDEFVSLPASLLQAGVRSVIGTLWTVPDFSSMLLMARLYEYLLGDCLLGGGRAVPPARALRMGQKWLKSATNEDIANVLSDMTSSSQEISALLKDQLGRYALSPDPTARPFEKPLFWAGFVLYGS